MTTTSSRLNREHRLFREKQSASHHSKANIDTQEAVPVNHSHLPKGKAHVAAPLPKAAACYGCLTSRRIRLDDSDVAKHPTRGLDNDQQNNKTLEKLGAYNYEYK